MSRKNDVVEVLKNGLLLYQSFHLLLLVRVYEFKRRKVVLTG